MSQKDREAAGSSEKKVQSEIKVSTLEEHHDETQLGTQQGKHRLFVDIARLCQGKRNWKSFARWLKSEVETRIHWERPGQAGFLPFISSQESLMHWDMCCTRWRISSRSSFSSWLPNLCRNLSGCHLNEAIL
mmetsp:Transcript_7769/g.48196  ORF Transcript_7769/g.48196 Transcript_7769/m.48196 type:complete len:132 (+) Transcript_7769:69-464(+)